VVKRRLFASRFSKHVYAYEPYPPVIEQFKDNVNRNGINNITLFEVGLGEQEAILPFSVPPGHNLGVGSFAANWDNKNGEMELKITTGDNHRKMENLPCPSLVNMDIEGYEKPALKGLHTTLNECRPILFVEVTTDSGSSFKDLSDLRSIILNGYKLYTIIETSPRSTHILSFETEQLSGKDNLLLVPTVYSDVIAKILASS